MVKRIANQPEEDDEATGSNYHENELQFSKAIKSGLYTLSSSLTSPGSPFEPRLPQPVHLKIKGEARIDVDGPYPQKAVSGVFSQDIKSWVHWIARLTRDKSSDSWTGQIWYKYPTPSRFLFTKVKIKFEDTPTSKFVAKMTFSGGGQPAWTCAFRLKSPYFHSAQFEFDWAEGEATTTSIQTWDHPNRPATLDNETLTIQKVYKRAGLNASQSPGGVVPLAGAGPDTKWSDIELHDAMQVYWSHFKDLPQWSIWVLFASLHEMGTGLGGIMFDDIGPNHRQGCVILNDSFISTPPTGDPNPTAWVKRMVFWTACHEMGHCFNLAHSWQKSMDNSWIPLSDEPEARSFMNYPYNVIGGESTFFSDFEYRFTDQELLFLRHAPEQFVQPGNAAWFDNHGFEGAMMPVEQRFGLVLRGNRDVLVFEYLEPVTLEVKLTNLTSQPQLVNEDILLDDDQMIVIIKKSDEAARQHIPYAQRCRSHGAKKVLNPEESLYESLYLYSGRNGWDIAKPGEYRVQVALRLEDGYVLSNPLDVRIAPPRGEKVVQLAGNFFTDSVGRIIAFDGSRVLPSGNETLRRVKEQLGDMRIALHAGYILGNEVAEDHKVLEKGSRKGEVKLAFKVKKAEPEKADSLVKESLIDHAKTAVESFGHVDYKWYTDRYSDWLARRGKINDAVNVQEVLYDTLAARQVKGRKVLDRVLQEIENRKAEYAGRM